MKLQEAVKRLRDELGYTQTEMAHALGISYVTISRWENGKVVPNERVAHSVMAIVKKMKVSPSCVDYLQQALFPQEENELDYMHRLDMNMAGQLVDGSSTGIFVADIHTYELLYLNKRMERFTDRSSNNRKGTTCYEYIHGRKTPCLGCELGSLHKDQYFEREFASDSGYNYMLRGKLMNWEGREAHVEYVSDEAVALTKYSTVRDMMNQVPGGIGVYDVFPDGRIKLVYLNDWLYTLMGVNREDLEKSTHVSAFLGIQEEDRERLVRLIHKAVEDHSIVSVDVRIRKPDGEYRWFHLQGQIANNKTDRSTLNLLISDIDEEKRTKDKLKAYMNAVAQAVGSRRVAFWQYDIETKCITQLGNYDSEEFVDRWGNPYVIENSLEKLPEMDAIHPDDIAGFLEAYRIIEGNDTAYEWDMRIKNMKTSQYMWMHCTLNKSLDEKTGKAMVIGFMHTWQNR